MNCSNTSARYNFVIKQGATTNFEIQYKDSEGIPIDLTYYGARMQLRPTAESPTLYLELSSSLRADGTGLNLQGIYGDKPYTSGSIGIFISAASSSMLNFNEAVYDLELSTAGYVDRILEGKIKLSKEVTR